MAKNWTLAELAIEMTKDNPTMDFMVEVTKRYPVLVNYMQKLITLQKITGGKDITDFLSVFPDYVTCLKINKFLQGGQQNDKVEEEYDASEPEPKRGKKAKPKKAELDDEDELDDEPEDDEDEGEDEGGKYDKMTAIQLFKECKKRKIKAETQKPQKYYIQLLEKDDAAKLKKAAKSKDDDGEWEDDEPKKQAKGKAKKVADDDDEEEWDF